MGQDKKEDVNSSDLQKTFEALADELTENEALVEGSDSDERVTLSKKEYQELQNALAKEKDDKLRALAELENFRKRTDRIQEEERKYASMDLARAILPVWDNLALALNIADPEKNGKAILDGVKMVSKEFASILAKNGIERIEALHQPFDPKFHESVGFAPSSEYEPNTVITEVKAGFILKDRVVRPAQVILAIPTSK